MSLRETEIATKARPADATAVASVSAAPASDAMAMPALAPGTVLKGKYRLESMIGEGGMGVVFRAVDIEAVDSNSLVAVKLLKPVLTTEESKAALFKEVEQTRKLQQENIVDVYSFEQDEHGAFMVMEFLTGRPLDKLIADDYALGMPLKLAWPIINGMGQGLAYAHRRGIIHSDFKPPNAFVTAVGTKVLDFGIARAAGAALQGLTIAYASCDMLEEMPPDPRDDVYAFGIVVYKVLTGKHPFCDDNGVELRATMARDSGMTAAPIRGLTRRQNAAIEGALRFDRAKRTRGIQEVLDGLERQGPPVFLWSAVLLLALGILGIGGHSLYRWLGPQDSDERFVARLLHRSAAPAIEADAETIKQMLELGQEFLHDGRDPINPGLLTENARPMSSALSAFRGVLLADPGNAAAAKGILEIVNVYKDEAQRLLAAGDLEKAAEMTRLALRLWPDSVDLQALDANIRAQLGPPDSKPR